MLETPRQLVTRFERGEIDRMEFQALMAIHQRELIKEIDEDHRNPLEAWLESRFARLSVRKLLKKHTAFQIREVLAALSEADGFPLAKYIWNAAHPDVPLHCFFRIRREPVFQILAMRSEGNTVVVAGRGVVVPESEVLTARAALIEQRFGALGLPARKWLRMVRPYKELPDPTADT